MSFAGFWGFARDCEAKLGYRRSCATTKIIVVRSIPDGARAELVRLWSRALINNANHLDFDSAILIGPLPQPHAEAK